MPAFALSSLPVGREVLLDANVIAYALQGRSLQCEELLRRSSRGEISAFTTTEVLSDVCHRLMLAEAQSRGLIARANASNLQGKSRVICQLQDYWTRLSTFTTQPIAILPLDEFRFVRAQPIRRDHGLMTNDSLLLAAAEVFGIEALATNDADFETVPWIEIYKPTDLV
jgi:predicted nucleic acid-binding protein